MRFGICCAPGALGEPRRAIEVLVEAGADYLEWTVQSVMASPAEFERLLAAVEDCPLRAEAFSVFLSPRQRLTGPEVDEAALLAYADEALRRCAALGARVVVLGSAASRRLPLGFSRERGLDQFASFARALAPVARDNGVTIAIEAVNSSEDNLLTTLEDAARLVRELDDPFIALTADGFHMDADGETFEHIVAAGQLVRHAHLADRGRGAPGTSEPGLDFAAFFSALKKAGYNERCSFEGKFHDFARQASSVLTAMRTHYQDVDNA